VFGKRKEAKTNKQKTQKYCADRAENYSNHLIWEFKVVNAVKPYRNCFIGVCPPYLQPAQGTIPPFCLSLVSLSLHFPSYIRDLFPASRPGAYFRPPWRLALANWARTGGGKGRSEDTQVNSL